LCELDNVEDEPMPDAERALSRAFVLVAHAVLEMNAFGDLLPGVLWQGLSTYEAQVEAILRGSGI
jgi:hypothetical protein